MEDPTNIKIKLSGRPSPDLEAEIKSTLPQSWARLDVFDVIYIFLWLVAGKSG